jgi:hypothetical protein
MKRSHKLLIAIIVGLWMVGVFAGCSRYPYGRAYALNQGCSTINRHH